MSQQPAASGQRGAKRPADHSSSEAGMAMGSATQRARLEEASSLHSPAAAALISQTPAQQCAVDALALAFSFLRLRELPSAMATCRAWCAAAAKEPPRGPGENVLLLADSLLDLGAIRSPLRRHVAQMDSCTISPLSLRALRQLATLPNLTHLHGVDPDAVELQSLVDQKGRSQALVDLQAAWPPRLRLLQLVLNQKDAIQQLLLDSLPAMVALKDLTFCSQGMESNSLSLEPLQRLPRLMRFTWEKDVLLDDQLAAISEMQPLRYLEVLDGWWNEQQLSAFCRPPHQLQLLSTIDLWQTVIGAAEMESLQHLPGLTTLHPQSLLASAYPFLPQLQLLRSLRISLDDYAAPQHSEAQPQAMDAALFGCASLTQLHGAVGADDDEAVDMDATGARLLRSAPGLRSLRLDQLWVSSLLFLQHAPQLEELSLAWCSPVPVSHLLLLGELCPRLTSLSLSNCSDLQLDELELQALTPPSRFLPSLITMHYSRHF